MFSELKKKVERYSADDKLAMQQRAIDEARVAQALELGGALRKGREEGRAEGREDERHAVARAMVEEGLDKAVICRVLKVTPEELEKLLV